MQITPCILLAAFCIIWFPPGLSLHPDGLALLELKKHIQSDPHGILSGWSYEDVIPCHWPGVSCVGGTVTKVNLSNQLLYGTLAPALGNLTALQNMLLGGNNLYGPIPKQLGSLQELRVLDLSHNKLQGKIPPEICNASKLIKLYLHNNGLEGNIPAVIGSLSKLYELRLDRNKLVGNVPVGDSAIPKQFLDGPIHLESLDNGSSHMKGLCALNNLNVGNFSSNYLTGPIPSCLNHSSVSFAWNCFDSNGKLSNQRPIWQCGNFKSSHSPYLLPSQFKGPDKHHSQWKTYLLSALVAGFLISLLSFIAIFFRCRHGAASVSPWRMSSSDALQKTFVTVVPEISRAELEMACEDFSNIIGSSSSSVVFKGTLSDGTEIAVTNMQAFATNWSRDLEICFRFKVDSLARINHKNLVKLLGYCSEDSPFARMLVFEYTPNGTLYDLLHNGDAEQLDWNARMRIIMGVAYGLEYIHHSLTPPASYSKFDSNSVFLTEDYAAKLAGFEVVKPSFLKKVKRKPSFTTDDSVNNDDLVNCGRDVLDFTEDIFGFGILLLELISGRPSYRKGATSLVDWASEFLNTPEVIAYMVDPVLRFFNYNQLESLCEIVRLCISMPPFRPNMKKITSMLETALGITSEVACPKSSPLLWAELAILTQM